MVDIVADVRGFEGIDEMLGGLARDFGPKNAATILNQPLRTAMKPIRDAIERTTPVDMGDLKDAVNLRVGRPSARRIRTAMAVDEFTVAEARAGWFWNRSTDSVNQHQALAVEFGTSKNPGGQHVLQRALRSGANQAVNTLSQELRPRLIKRARELARRKANNQLRIR